MRSAFFALILAAAATGCRTSDGSTVAASEPTAAQPAADAGGDFVGCAPSAGECRHSCPQNNGQGVEDPERCPDTFSPFACTCPNGTGGGQTPPDPNTHFFVGCVPTGSECKNSCPSQQVVAFQGSDACFPQEFACYCKMDP